MIVGTAGHIDHGKTSLVRRLTGIDTDRLPEEKQRGMTIDLGFAHIELEGVGQVGIVDVPGHERFVRNMVAGATGIDLVLLVIAADDGIMPQTREHLNIIGLLGIASGIVALSKVDLVDAERVAVVTMEIRALLGQTLLASAPIVPVSSESGAGMDTLKRELTRCLSTLRSKSEAWPFWMAVDRAFVVRGFGAVVTGTIASGRVARDATLRLLPGGQTVRVRGIQIHGHPAESAVAGNRCALNLAGVDKESLGRGMVVCDPGLNHVAGTLDAQVTLAPDLAKTPKSHSRVRFHSGTAETMARLQWLEPTAPEPGGSGLAQLRLDSALPLLFGQRYILRDETAQRTIGGGVVLDAFAERRGARLPQRIERLRRLSTLDADESLSVCLEARGADGWLVTELAEQLAEAPQQLEQRFARRGDVLRELVEGTAWIGLRGAVDALLPKLVAATAAHLSDRPRDTAVALATLHAMVCRRLDLRIFRSLLNRLVAAGALELTSDGVRPVGHRQNFSPADIALANRLEELLAHRGKPPPKLEELARETRLPVARVRRFLGELERSGRMVRLTEGVYVTRKDLELWREAAHVCLGLHERMTVAQFRDHVGVGRGLAIMILERFDQEGVTRRIGDARVAATGTHQRAGQ